VLAGQHDEWAESRRYMGQEILTACCLTGKGNETSETSVTIDALRVIHKG